MPLVIPFPAPRAVEPTPAIVALVAPFEFVESDEATLARIEVRPDEGRTYLWSVETLAEVVSRLIIRGEDGDADASDLAGFLLFTTMDLAGAEASVAE